MNVELLLAVKKAILENPERLSMMFWFVNQAGCGTAGCIAGWTIVRAEKREWPESKDTNRTRIGNTAAGYLDIDYRQRDALFELRYWPSHFSKDYYAARTAQQRADIVARRIDHFVTTDGRE